MDFSLLRFRFVIETTVILLRLDLFASFDKRFEITQRSSCNLHFVTHFEGEIQFTEKVVV